jgi:hypothetical protein
MKSFGESTAADFFARVITSNATMMEKIDALFGAAEKITDPQARGEFVLGLINHSYFEGVSGDEAGRLLDQVIYLASHGSDYHRQYFVKALVDRPWLAKGIDQDSGKLKFLLDADPDRENMEQDIIDGLARHGIARIQIPDDSYSGYRDFALIEDHKGDFELWTAYDDETFTDLPEMKIWQANLAWEESDVGDISPKVWVDGLMGLCQKLRNAGKVDEAQVVHQAIVDMAEYARIETREMLVALKGAQNDYNLARKYHREIMEALEVLSAPITRPAPAPSAPATAAPPPPAA